jgi:hypothetical protein
VLLASLINDKAFYDQGPPSRFQHARHFIISGPGLREHSSTVQRGKSRNVQHSPVAKPDNVSLEESTLGWSWVDHEVAICFGWLRGMLQWYPEGFRGYLVTLEVMRGRVSAFS